MRMVPSAMALKRSLYAVRSLILPPLNLGSTLCFANCTRFANPRLNARLAADLAVPGWQDGNRMLEGSCQFRELVIRCWRTGRW